MQYVFSTKPDAMTCYQFPTHGNDLVIDRTESVTSEVFMVRLNAGQAPPLHKHEDTEQVFYIISGRGMLEIKGVGEHMACSPGDVVRIPPGTWHRVHCQGDKPLGYLCVDCFPGGRPTVEPTWESHVRVMCKEQGWNFDEVMQSS